MSIYYNITGSTAQSLELKEDYTNSEEYKYVCFTNVHDTDSVSVDLYITRTIEKSSTGSGLDESGNDIIDLQDGVQNYQRNDLIPAKNTDDYTTTSASSYSDGVSEIVETYYYMKNLVIPKGVTLKYDYNDLLFNRNLYILKIKLSASNSAVDVIIK